VQQIAANSIRARNVYQSRTRWQSQMLYRSQSGSTALDYSRLIVGRSTGVRHCSSR
jgi:hypothetical protein